MKETNIPNQEQQNQNLQQEQSNQSSHTGRPSKDAGRVKSWQQAYAQSKRGQQQQALQDAANNSSIVQRAQAFQHTADSTIIQQKEESTSLDDLGNKVVHQLAPGDGDDGQPDPVPDPPLEERARLLYEAFQGGFLNGTYEQQAIDALKGLTHDQINQLETIYTQNYGALRNVQSLKEDLFYDMKDTPKEFFQAAKHYMGLPDQPTLTDWKTLLEQPKETIPEEHIGTTLLDPVEVRGHNNIQSNTQTNANIINQGATIKVTYTPNEVLENPSMFNAHHVVEDEYSKAFLKRPNGKHKKVDIDERSFDFSAKEVGTYEAIIVIQERNQTHNADQPKVIRYFYRQYQVLSEADYATVGFQQAPEPAPFEAHRVQYILAEEAAKTAATLYEGKDSQEENGLSINWTNMGNGVLFDKLGGEYGPAIRVQDLQYLIFSIQQQEGHTYDWSFNDTDAIQGEGGAIILPNARGLGRAGFLEQELFGDQTGRGQYDAVFGPEGGNYTITVQERDPSGALTGNTASLDLHVPSIQEQKRATALSNYNEKITEESSSISEDPDHPMQGIKAIHTTKETGEQITLNWYLGRDRQHPDQWVLLDSSPNPAAEQRRDFRANSLDDLIKEIRSENAYPTGNILVQFPDEDQPRTLTTKGKSDMAKTGEGLGVASLIMGVIGTVMLFTPAAPAGAVFIGGSIATGAGASALIITDELKKENPNAGTILLESANLVASILAAGVGGLRALAATAKSAQSAKTAAHLANRLGYAALAVDGGQLVYLSVDTINQLDQILSDESMSREERIRRLANVVLNASMVGGMYYAGARANKKNNPVEQQNPVTKIQEQTTRLEEINTKIEQNNTRKEQATKDKAATAEWFRQLKYDYARTSFIIDALAINLAETGYLIYQYTKQATISAQGLYLHLQKNLTTKQLHKNFEALNKEEQALVQQLLDNAMGPKKNDIENLAEEYLCVKIGQQGFTNGVTSLYESKVFYDYVRQDTFYQNSPYYKEYAQKNWQQLSKEEQAAFTADVREALYEYWNRKVPLEQVRIDLDIDNTVLTYLQAHPNDMDRLAQAYINTTGVHLDDTKTFWKLVQQDPTLKKGTQFTDRGFVTEVMGAKQYLQATIEQNIQPILAKEIEQYRVSVGIQKGMDLSGNTTGGTVGAGILVLHNSGRQSQNYIGASPNANPQSQYNQRYQSPQTHGSTKNHAEQHMLGNLADHLEVLIQNGQYKDKSSIEGTFYIFVDQRVCNACIQGYDKKNPKPPGVIKQFSTEFPNITLIISNASNSKTIKIESNERKQ